MVATLSACSFMRVKDALGGYRNNANLPTESGHAPHLEGRFANPQQIPEMPFSKKMAILAKFMFGKKTNTVPDIQLPTLPLDAGSFSTPVTEGYRVTWIGHSTTLIEMDGLKILTDPVFGERASPFKDFGPKRFQPAAISIADLPHLDVVVISHDHYDHLDMGSIKALKEKTDLFVMPLDVGTHLRHWGVEAEKIIELDWWDETVVAGSVRLIATPARHFSGRGMSDKNKTLWASWVIANQSHSLFFSGDTGMQEAFSEIGQRFGPFDLAMIENGAYDPAWPNVHMSPEETVEAAVMLGAKRLMPIHWGTFDLANHPWYEPAERVQMLAATRNIPLAHPRQGESVGTDLPWPIARWWQIPVDRVADIEQVPAIQETGS